MDAPTPSKSHPFVLSRATINDMPQIVDLEFRVFTDPLVRDTFMGPDTAENHRALSERYTKTMQTDHGDHWIKVVDSASGKIIAAANWKIYPVLCPDASAEDKSLPWLKDHPERLAKSAAVLESVVETKKQVMTGPHVFLNICFTSAEFQRRGAGKMMLQWGCEIADRLFLPGWVHASPDGNLLYKTFGFRETDEGVESEMEGGLMKRDVMVTCVEGGR